MDGAKGVGIGHITAMEEENLEVVVTPGNWQMAGMPPRWNWQVRQKHPSKFLVKGIASGPQEKAHEAANAAKAKILARLANSARLASSHQKTR